MASWIQNEATASRRRCLLRVMNMATGRLADRGINFASYVYITRGGTKSYAALGTIENHRRDLVVADDIVESVDAGADTMTLTAHGYETGDGPFVADEAMGAIGLGTQFWIINPATGGTGGNLISIASSLVNAYAGTVVPLTGTETGAIISDVVGSTERGIDGEFIYSAAAAEATYSVTELVVSIFGFAYHEGQTTVTIDQAGSVWSAGDGSGTGRTMGDLVVGTARTAMGRIIIDPVTGAYVVRNLDDTADSHGGTISATGRDDIDLSGLA